MAGRPRKPVAINKKHFTKEEKEQREAEELNVPFTDVAPPDYLSAQQKRDFNEYAEKLVALGIFTELDVDVLAQFVIARELYIGYSKQVKKILDKANAVHKWSVVESLAADCEEQEDLKKLLEKIIRRQRGEDITVLMNLQDKAHKQCLACAKELGLTITSRLKLVIPQPQDDEDDEL
ncbi:MAG: phage terminase small subunit P27 family [Clostridia bacterium]|nr:phage terminase small subunit P27 family [Clostridia bacterium]